MTAKPDTHSTRFTMGARVECSDGACGTVTRVVIDPIARALTHLVVEPKHRVGLGRLVPLSLLDPASVEIRLRCTVADFDELDAAEETHYLTGSNTYSDYAEARVLVLPYYGLGVGRGGDVEVGTGADTGPLVRSDITDLLPAGEVAIHRGDQVHAVDGEIGHVQGIVIADPGHQVTHVLLQEGHLFGRKDVAIPIGTVASVDAGIRLSITKQQVQDLPSVDVRRPAQHISPRTIPAVG